jgi:hypothetical protein
MYRWLALVFLLTGPALAQSPTLLSKTFTMSAHCTGEDLVYSWSVNSKAPGTGAAPPPTEYGNAFIYPWRSDDIIIRGVEVANQGPAGLAGYLFGPAYFGWMMVGNDAAEDIMLTAGSDLSHADIMFPSGSGFFFPGQRNMTPTTYIDLHGACRWPRKANVLVTIYYSPVERKEQASADAQSHP